MDRNKKLEELLHKKAAAEERLKRLMIGYRGVVHESAQSELRHSDVMVAKDYLRSLEAEIAESQSDK